VEAVLAGVYIIGVLGSVMVGRARLGISQRGRLDGATMMNSIPWVAAQIASMFLWPVFLVVWLAKGRPETPWEAVTTQRGHLKVRRRTTA
jgi:hypothetical protein